jgi:hypothetical protein
MCYNIITERSDTQMTIKEYLEITNFEALDIEIDVWRKDTNGIDIALNLKSLTVEQAIKSKFKKLKVESVDVYTSSCGSWGGFIRLDINVK